ncbi:HCL042Wp [Eremothecium sinecaudum]|uniref:HCL042Wp n=1 Tax=Eremothecium sinecaudum TaxID=45286 RepID=A0A0X8HRI1_9SACH|nr:HCL042Wp [Eremothecium sinecaudum]AMD20109.1 HCL042Wp [Eremothecium sinecaudum]
MEKFEVLVAVERLAFSWPVITGKDVELRGLLSRLEEVGLDLFESPHYALFFGEREQRSALSHSDKSDRSQCSNVLVLRKALAHQYATAITLLESANLRVVNYVEKCRQMMRIHVLANSFLSVSDLDTRLRLYLRSRPSQNTYDQESEYILECKLLTFASLFLRGNYFDAAHYFTKLYCESGDVLDYLLCPEKVKDIFITNEEYLLMIIISMLLSVPLENYRQLLSSQATQKMFQRIPLLLKCLTLLSNTRYHEFFVIWQDDLERQAQGSYFISPRWQRISTLMRCKVIFLYLKISNVIYVSYLSKVLGISKEAILDDVAKLISRFNLNFAIEGNTIYFKEQSPICDIISGIKTASDRIDARNMMLQQKNEAIKEFVQQTYTEQGTGSSVGNQ